MTLNECFVKNCLARVFIRIWNFHANMAIIQKATNLTLTSSNPTPSPTSWPRP